MKAILVGMAVTALWVCADCLAQQAGPDEELSGPRRLSTTNQIARPSLEWMTNAAVTAISRVREVNPGQIKIEVLPPVSAGRFEIDLAGAKNVHGEASEVSRQLGTNAVVILQQATEDGLYRTNWSFRNGQETMVRAPVANSGLKPGAKRMYVWAENPNRDSEPARVRVVEGNGR